MTDFYFLDNNVRILHQLIVQLIGLKYNYIPLIIPYSFL